MTVKRPPSSSAKGPPKNARQLAVRVHTARSRSHASTIWLQRQLNDPYVIAAQKAGYRSRAAFKLIQLDEKYKFLKVGQRIVDLGAAPGGWTQVAVERIKSREGKGYVVGIDLLPIDPIDGAILMEGDFMADDAPQRLKDAMNGPADIVMSDMAANTTGDRGTDHLRIMMLAEMAAHFAGEVLAPNGVFICKLFQGGAQKSLLDFLRVNFKTVRHAKPAASRSDSAETYVVATGFRG